MSKPISEPSQPRENAYLGWTSNQLLRRPSIPSTAICQIQVDYFSAEVTTYTTPAGTTFLVMEAVGAGGGGGAVAPGSPLNKGAGGGGAGGYARVTICAPESSYDIVAPAGGAAGLSASSDVDGGTEVDLTVTALIAGIVLECGAGVGGKGVIDANSVPIGGKGGTGGAGDVLTRGGSGLNGTVGTGGKGGDSYWGGGGQAGITSTFPYNHTAGDIGAAFSGGGGGGACQDPIPLTGYDGGAGADSLLTIFAFGP